MNAEIITAVTVKTFYFLYSLLLHSIKLKKAVLSRAVHFNTNKINVYAHYADTRKINIHTIAQLVTFQPLTTEAYVQFQASPCGICSG